jgi:hypothetical protein
VYQSIQLSLNQTDVEIASLRRQLGDHQSRVADLRRALDTMPKVEAEYAQLNRDYDVNKTQYTALLTQLEKAKLGQEADTNGSVRFEIVEPPNAEYKPVSPHRNLLVLAVLGSGLGRWSRTCLSDSAPEARFLVCQDIGRTYRRDGVGCGEPRVSANAAAPQALGRCLLHSCLPAAFSCWRPSYWDLVCWASIWRSRVTLGSLL